MKIIVSVEGSSWNNQSIWAHIKWVNSYLSHLFKHQMIEKWEIIASVKKIKYYTLQKWVFSESVQLFIQTLNQQEIIVPYWSKLFAK